MDRLLYTAGVLIAVGGALAALTKWVVQPLVRLVRDTHEFLLDWRGQSGRPGVAERRGVMQRLAQIEYHVGNGRDVPLRDVVERMEQELAEHLGEHRQFYSGGREEMGRRTGPNGGSDDTCANP